MSRRCLSTHTAGAYLKRFLPGDAAQAHYQFSVGADEGGWLAARVLLLCPVPA
jgi:hypothetical protein